MSDFKPVYILDSSNLARRAFSAFPALATAEIPVNAAYGVVRMVLSMMRTYPPGRIISVFDYGKSKYRFGLYPEYKLRAPATAKEEAELQRYYGQVPMIEELLAMMGILTIGEEIKGIEADDAISYMCHKVNTGSLIADRATIVSADKDLCGLISDKVYWYDAMHNNLITLKNFEQTFGVKLSQYWDFKALKGDASDNVPHPPGIGEKTAAKLLQEHSTLEHMRTVPVQKVADHWDTLLLGQKLVTLDLYNKFPEWTQWAAIDERLQFKPSISGDLQTSFVALEFNSLIADWDRHYDSICAFHAHS